MNGLLDLVFVVHFEPAAHFPHGRKHVTAHALEALQERNDERRRRRSDFFVSVKKRENQSERKDSNSRCVDTRTCGCKHTSPHLHGSAAFAALPGVVLALHCRRVNARPLRPNLTIKKEKKEEVAYWNTAV